MRSIFLLTLLFLLMPAVQAHPGWGVAEDSEGNLYYTDLEHVWRVAPDGTRTIAVRDVHTHELFIDADGNLLGENLWYSGGEDGQFSHHVWQMDSAENVTVLRESPGFRTDDSFVRDAAGTAYWHDGSELFRKASTGENVPHGAQSIDAIQAMTAAQDGSLFVMSNGDLQMLGPDGSIRRSLEGFAQGRLTQPMVPEQHRVLGLWPASDGGVYAAQYGARRADKVSVDGTVETIASTWLPWSPTGGIETRDGDVWLLEYSLFNQARLRKVGETQPISWSFWGGLLLPILLAGWGALAFLRRRHESR
ncbi:NHL repeat-containing protein [Altererythrobacter lutimaris]|uniref:Uncharacterized protein n=1 Tax=Altererythrobacter lutimaris TaxID=2743979 RepID=A0A850H736_9SPHN|nr:hypothetical protein [Altererythrobacter lutimaris]NVE93653.1 hypothetical protein [Altererythrobacter lutimaris]